MITYDLYLESGPRHKTTMVHVLVAERYYTQAFSGPVDGLNALGKQVERGEIEVRAGLAEAGTRIV